MDRYDIQYDDSGLEVRDNDLMYGISDQQHVKDTINAAPGWWKENFQDGVNVRAYLASQGQEQVLARSIKIQLEADLYTCLPVVQFNPDGKLIVQPNASI